MKKDTQVSVAASKEANTWTDEQIELIKSTVAKGATDDELKLFLYTAKRTGLDPLTKQIHFVKRGGQMSIQTGIDGYRTIAERTQSLAGIDDAKYDIGEESNKPLKATVTVYRFVNDEKVAFTASARWSEYAPQGNQAFMWNKMPFLMLGKCAESLALRKAFPNDLTGLYTDEEMHQAEAKIAPISPIEEKKRTLKMMFDKLGITGKEAIVNYIKYVIKLDPANPDNVDEVISRLTLIIEENGK